MKMTRLLTALLFFVPLIQSCQADIEDLADPRDGIVKMWRVTDDYDATGANGYDVTIRKNSTEKTQILFDNFGNFDTTDDLYATFDGSTITIPSQVLDGTYTIQGDGSVKNNGENITLTYNVNDGDVSKTVTANYGPVVTAKKKMVKASNVIQ